VQVRTMDIVRARYNLSRELYDTIRANNLSGLPIEIVLAQAGAESSFWVTHGGKLKEIGLFQLRPVTANDQGLGKFTDQQIQNAALNTRLATTYMKTLTAMFGDVRIALVAYNQGPGNTMRKGLLPRAQIYADAILQASRHSRFQARLRALDPQFRPHAGVPTIRRTSGQNSTGPSPDTQPKPPINAPMRMRAATPANARPQQPRP
jgi:soluble lytic murein transglycosylase-like protein